MRFELYPPEQSNNSNIDYLLIEEGLAVVRDGFNDTMYPEVIRLACKKRGYLNFMGLVYLAIQLAKEELGQSPQGILQVNWVGNWRVLVAGQVVNVMEFDTDANGGRSNDSPSNCLILYNRFQWNPPADKKIRIVDSKGRDVKSEGEIGESGGSGANTSTQPETPSHGHATTADGKLGTFARFDMFLNGRKINWRTIQMTEEYDSDTKQTKKTMEVFE